MTWFNVLKYENVNNMTTEEFGNQVIDGLEALGFEIKYHDNYQERDMTYRYAQKLKRRERFREYTTMSEEDLEGYDGSYGYGEFGHELVITDSEEPYAYRTGFGADTLTVKYLPDDFDLYSNPRNEDYPVLAINSFKIDDVELVTQNGKKKIDVKFGLKRWENSRQGVRNLVKAILDAFKDYAQYEEDFGDMSEEEIRMERGQRAGRRFAAGARSLGDRDGY